MLHWVTQEGQKKEHGLIAPKPQTVIWYFL